MDRRYWLSLLNERRSIYPRVRAAECAVHDGYALCIRNAIFSNLKMNVCYRIHAFFFDRKHRSFFGNMFRSEWCRSAADTIPFDEFWTAALFYRKRPHSLSAETELVEGNESSNSNTNYRTAGWTVVPIEQNALSVTDYSNSMQGTFTSKCSLHQGSPKSLIFANELSEFGDIPETLRKTNGTLEICLQTHEKLLNVIKCIPEWFLLSKRDEVPGIVDNVITPDPRMAERKSYLLSDLKVSFGTNISKFEQVLLHLLNNDRLYRANRSPSDINVKPMEVLERRIMIGVHNTFKYLNGVQRLHLTEKRQFSTLNSPRKTRLSLSGSSSDARLNPHTLHMQGNVVLNTVDDCRCAIVFTLEYVVGVHALDGTVYSSQNAAVCWGFWLPFLEQSLKTASTVPMFGGPTHNPNKLLCFKNMVSWGQESSEALANITASFSFTELDDKTIKLAEIRKPIEKSRAKSADITDFSLSKVIPRTTEDMKMRREKVKDEAISTFCLEHTVKVEKEDRTSKDQASNSEVIDAENYMKAHVHSIPRILQQYRTIATILSCYGYALVKDRNGKEPKIVNPVINRPVDINVEINDRLNTHETIVQFMAILNSAPEDNILKNITSVFFTLHFYRFQTVTTERMLLEKVNLNEPNQQMYLLKRTVSNGDGADGSGYGFMVKYTIGRGSLPNEDCMDYVEYLMNDYLIVDVWDADALLHLGVSYIPLKYLLRQGCEAVQANVQSPVVQNLLPGSYRTTCNIALKLANIGHPSNRLLPFGYVRKGTDALISRHLLRLGESCSMSYRIRAKPLNALHENALQRFISEQSLDLKQRHEDVMKRDTPKVSEERISKQWTTQDDGPVLTKGTVKRYLYHQELEAYKRLRNEDKAARLLKAVFEAITVEHSIFPIFGQVVFFEFLVQSTDPEVETIAIECSHHCLRPLLDSAAWKFYKHLYGSELPTENDEFWNTRRDITDDTKILYLYMKPLESICVPFIYDSFASSCRQNRDQVKAIFKKKASGEPIAILDMLVECRRNIIVRVFRFYQPARTKFTKLIRVIGLEDNRKVGSCRCTDPLVLLSIKCATDGLQDLLISCHIDAAPTIRTFTIIFFADKYYHDTLGAWTVQVHAISRIEFSAVEAQLTKIPLFLKAENDEHLVNFYKHSDNVDITPSQSVKLQPGSTVDATACFTPYKYGKQAIEITAVDCRMQHVLNEWMLMANVEKANITKIFEVYLKRDTTQTIKLAITNSYGVERIYRISSSNPKRVSVDNSTVVMKPYQISEILVTFMPVTKPTLNEVTIFISNAEDNLQEEAYLLKLIYS